MKEVMTIVFGSNAPLPACSWTTTSTAAGGSPPKTMKEAAENLGNSLSEKFGEAMKFAYVDVKSDEMKNYPDITSILSKVNLPLIVVDGKPRFHGGITLSRIEKLVNELLAKNWFIFPPFYRYDVTCSEGGDSGGVMVEKDYRLVLIGNIQVGLIGFLLNLKAKFDRSKSNL